MNNIIKTFEALKAKQQCACIPYVVGADPTLPLSKEVLIELAHHGADMLLIALPFSDPAADGPIIQRANLRALSNHIGSDDIFAMIKEVRANTTQPILCQLYFNQVFTYGMEAFLKRCASSGVNGLIIPDLPLEHQDEILPFAHAYDIAVISMITPGAAHRKEAIVKQSEGFLYSLLPLDPTQSPHAIQAVGQSFFQELHELGNIAKVLGIESLSCDQVLACSEFADGILLRTSIVEDIAKLSKSEITLQTLCNNFEAYANACHKQ